MKIAGTSGCFDLIHAGHVWMFNEMRQTGGLVLVLLNDDSYLRYFKNRSITPLNERMTILRAMRNVDIVIPFHDYEPSKLIKLIEPDYWFKGPEYRGVDIPETSVVESYGGKVVFSQGGPIVHTSDIIERIR
jgi:rfaE bifunctional protein nucleotidyltransferase chain/domain